MVRWCEDLKKFNNLVIGVELANDIHSGVHNWGQKYYKTLEECLAELDEAESLLTCCNGILSISAIYKIRSFYELKSNILWKLKRSEEAYSYLLKALNVSTKDRLIDALSRVFYLVLLALIVWYIAFLPLFH